MSLFSSWIASPPPDAAIEIATDHVAVAVVGDRSGGLVVQSYASEVLTPGTVTASLTASNIHNRAAVVSALRAALDRAGIQPRRVALVVPDLAAKVSLVVIETARTLPPSASSSIQSAPKGADCIEREIWDAFSAAARSHFWGESMIRSRFAVIGLS